MGRRRSFLLPGHRRENYGEPMKNIMLALRQIAEENRDVELVYPVHLSPVVREAVDTYLRGTAPGPSHRPAAGGRDA